MSDQTRYLRLAQITQLINSKFDLRSVLEHVVTAISEEIIQCTAVGIYLAQPDGTFRGFVGKPDQIAGVTLDQLVADPSNDTLIAQVVAEKKMLYIPDTSLDPRPDREVIHRFQMKSLLVVPISFDNELFGLVFLFNHGSPMYLSSEEIETITAYVNMTAVALRNANLLTHTQTLLSEKQLLVDALHDLSSCMSTEEVLNVCFRFVGQALNNQNIGIHIADAVGARFRPVRLSRHADWTEQDWKAVHQKLRLNYEEDLLFQDVIRNKRSALVPDVEKDPRPNHEACRRFGIRGVYMIPLVVAGDVLGVVAVVSLGVPRTYTEAQMRLAESIVDATATALSNTLRTEQLETIIHQRTTELEEKNRMLENLVEELRRLTERTTLILDSVTEGIYGLDAEGRITFCNPSAARLVGWDQTEIIGRLQHDIFWHGKSEGQDCPLAACPILAPIRTGIPSQVNDELFRRKDGSTFPVDYISTPMRENGRIQGAVVVFKDVTDRKRSEELMLKSEKLSVVGQLAAGVAHEIRNPLTALKGFIQLLQSNANSKEEYFHIMLSELDRIELIINELLILAKPVDVQFQFHDLRTLIETVAALLRTQAILNNVQIVTDCDSSIPRIHCDDNRLKQVFVNLLKNAIEAMPDGGQILIQARMAGDRTIRIRIVDEGTGIPSDRLPRLGEPFFTTKEKGVGLGLTMSYQIIESHGGEMRFQSEVGKGTTVEVLLPVDPRHHQNQRDLETDLSCMGKPGSLFRLPTKG
ncbi:MAG: GAF domain-containing protein [Kyrpidia sp.]|nr:GAF domain-containing protein [Kyrpidia sp.]